MVRINHLSRMSLLNAALWLLLLQSLLKLLLKLLMLYTVLRYHLICLTRHFWFILRIFKWRGYFETLNFLRHFVIIECWGLSVRRCRICGFFAHKTSNWDWSFFLKTNRFCQRPYIFLIVVTSQVNNIRDVVLRLNMHRVLNFNFRWAKLSAVTWLD